MVREVTHNFVDLKDPIQYVAKNILLSTKVQTLLWLKKKKTVLQKT